ncbi:alpha/beta hydrolase, partial [Saccharothrix sp. MB29]|nr:alpha/beta hydrolase [Saccharothrix sp. MB29]
AVDDCRTAVAWIAAHAAELGVDPDRLAVAGDSAGGNLAAVVTLDRGGPALAAQVLVYPNTDHRGDTESMRENDDPAAFNRRSVAWYWGQQVGLGHPRQHHDVVRQFAERVRFHRRSGRHEHLHVQRGQTLHSGAQHLHDAEGRAQRQVHQGFAVFEHPRRQLAGLGERHRPQWGSVHRRGQERRVLQRRWADVEVRVAEHQGIAPRDLDAQLRTEVGEVGERGLGEVGLLPHPAERVAHRGYARDIGGEARARVAELVHDQVRLAVGDDRREFGGEAARHHRGEGVRDPLGDVLRPPRPGVTGRDGERLGHLDAADDVLDAARGEGVRERGAGEVADVVA